MKRKALFACVCLLIIVNQLSGQQKADQATVEQKQLPTTIILLRHAEKMADSSKDPLLTEQGHERARAFARMFSLLNPDAIYSTNYHRSMSTAEPLARQNGLDIQIYKPEEQNAFLDKVVAEYQGGTVVIVGHSNTVPFAVNYLLQEDLMKEMPETEYDKVFVINVLPDGKAKLLPLVLEL